MVQLMEFATWVRNLMFVEVYNNFTLKITNSIFIYNMVLKKLKNSCELYKGESMAIYVFIFKLTADILWSCLGVI